MLLDRLLGGLAFAARADAEYHLEGDGEQQQTASDAKAGNEMPSARNSQSPNSATPTSIKPAMMLARSATLRRPLRGSPSVTTRKVGVRPTGSTTTKSVNSAETAKSSGMAGIVPASLTVVLCANAKDSRKAWGNPQGRQQERGAAARGRSPTWQRTAR